MKAVMSFLMIFPILDIIGRMKHWEIVLRWMVLRKAESQNYDRKNFVDDHRQKHVEITKKCLGIEIAD